MAPRYNQVDGDEDGWRQDVDNLEETLGNLGLEERVRYQDIMIFLFLFFSNGNDRKGGSKETA